NSGLTAAQPDCPVHGLVCLPALRFVLSSPAGVDPKTTTTHLNKMNGMNQGVMRRYNVVRLTLIPKEEAAEDGAANQRVTAGAATTTARPDTMTCLEFSRAVLQRGMGFLSSDLNCLVKRPEPQESFEASFKNPQLLEQFWSKCSPTPSIPPFRHRIQLVTVQFHNECIQDYDIQVWLSSFTTLKSVARRILDEDNVWTGARKQLVLLRLEPTGVGSVQHLPSTITLGINRGSSSATACPNCAGTAANWAIWPQPAQPSSARSNLPQFLRRQGKGQRHQPNPNNPNPKPTNPPPDNNNKDPEPDLSTGTAQPTTQDVPETAPYPVTTQDDPETAPTPTSTPSKPLLKWEPPSPPSETPSPLPAYPIPSPSQYRGPPGSQWGGTPRPVNSHEPPNNTNDPLETLIQIYNEIIRPGPPRLPIIMTLTTHSEKKDFPQMAVQGCLSTRESIYRRHKIQYQTQFQYHTQHQNTRRGAEERPNTRHSPRASIDLRVVLPPLCRSSTSPSTNPDPGFQHQSQHQTTREGAEEGPEITSSLERACQREVPPLTSGLPCMSAPPLYRPQPSPSSWLIFSPDPAPTPGFQPWDQHDFQPRPNPNPGFLGPSTNSGQSTDNHSPSKDDSKSNYTNSSKKLSKKNI
ncbi:unnamed protein product, partial [Coregonus sp. 'balchen']